MPVLFIFSLLFGPRNRPQLSQSVFSTSPPLDHVRQSAPRTGPELSEHTADAPSRSGQGGLQMEVPTLCCSATSRGQSGEKSLWYAEANQERIPENGAGAAGLRELGSPPDLWASLYMSQWSPWHWPFDQVWVSVVAYNIKNSNLCKCKQSIWFKYVGNYVIVMLEIRCAAQILLLEKTWRQVWRMGSTSLSCWPLP